MQCLTASRDLYYAYDDVDLGHTGRGFMFNDIFRDFLVEMRVSKREDISPSTLFKSICRKVHRFRGYQVNSSHLTI